MITPFETRITGDEHDILSLPDGPGAGPAVYGDHRGGYNDRNHEECSRVELAEDMLEHILCDHCHSKRETWIANATPYASLMAHMWV